MKRNLHLGLLLGLMLSLMQCAAPEKLVDQGRFDDAIEVAIRRIAGKKQPKTKYVEALEEAFAKANSRDMAYADRLKRDQLASAWPKIFNHYQRIRARQERLAGLLPLANAYGVQAEFSFVRVEPLEREAREKAAAYYYQRAQVGLERARNGDRLAAREAYDLLEKTERYFPHFRDKEQLQDLALSMGTTYILLDVTHRTHGILPSGIEQILLGQREDQLNSTWRIFHTQPVDDLDYDYKVVLELIDLDVSPERIQERSYREEREIETGWTYVLDEKGQVAKDSLGNDRKVPRVVSVSADVVEQVQSKAARIQGRMSFYDLASDRVLEVREIQADALFEHYAATYRGDRRALSRQTLQRIGGQPLPFPSDVDLLMEAARRLNPAIGQELRRSQILP